MALVYSMYVQQTVDFCYVHVVEYTCRMDTLGQWGFFFEDEDELLQNDFEGNFKYDSLWLTSNKGKSIHAESYFADKLKTQLPQESKNIKTAYLDALYTSAQYRFMHPFIGGSNRWFVGADKMVIVQITLGHPKMMISGYLV